ncbi:unnamed protein product, partial [Scytosiphon promiscuus]
VGVEFRGVNEDYTSKLCSKYHEVLQPMLDERSKPIYTVRRCPTTSCVRLWNRDVNVGRNIRDIFFHENSHHGWPPEMLTRAYHRALS